MTESRDARLMAFLHGELEEDERMSLLDELDSNPELAAALREAARGFAAMEQLGTGSGDADTGTDSITAPPSVAPRPGISPWWAVAASVATLALSVPATIALAGGPSSSDPADPSAGTVALAADLGIPQAPEPSFMLVLHDTWSDAGEVTEEEAQRRAEEYWGWTSSLAERGVLLAAGDLRWEAGARVRPGGDAVWLASDVVQNDDFLVGMFALRVGSYEEAMAVARECPHLAYGGSVSVRQVGGGFVTTPGVADWSD